MWSRGPRHPALRNLVETLWVSSADKSARRLSSPPREWVLPTGRMHLVLRFSEAPLRLYRDLDDETGWLAGDSIVGGARDSAYLRDISLPSSSVGVKLRPGAAPLLFGVPADALAGRHTQLEDLFGGSAGLLREELEEPKSPEGKLARFEAFLASRVRADERLTLFLEDALTRLDGHATIRAAIEDSGYSHRHFITLFRRAVGLSPKCYLRILRFQRALERMRGKAPLAQVALASGFSDQAHFTREFREISGMSPSAYRALAPKSPNHVEVNFLQD